jgi:hypothetical protein
VAGNGTDWRFGTILSVSNQLPSFTWSYWCRIHRLCNALQSKHVAWSMEVFTSAIALLVSNSSDQLQNFDQLLDSQSNSWSNCLETQRLRGQWPSISQLLWFGARRSFDLRPAFLTSRLSLLIAQLTKIEAWKWNKKDLNSKATTQRRTSIKRIEEFN